MASLRAAAEARTYSIGDLADLFNLSRRTLRFYEERELLRPCRDGAQRIYSESDRVRLEIIIRAKRFGFSLAAIRQFVQRRAPEASTAADDVLLLSRDEIRAQIEHLTSKRERVHRAIEELRQAAMRQGWAARLSMPTPQTSA